MRRSRWLFPAALLIHLAIPRQAGGAFEHFSSGPVENGRGDAGPAWPASSHPLTSGPVLFGGTMGFGLVAGAARWEAAPGLAADNLLLWLSRGASLMTVMLRRLSIPGYAETRIAAGWSRPAAEGFCGALSAGLDVWNAADLGEASPFLMAGVGFAAFQRYRLAAVIEDHPGNPEVAAGRLEIGATWDPAPAWTIGAGVEAGRQGGLGTLKVGLEGRPGGSVVLRMGLSPASGTASLGLGYHTARWGVDTSRRDDPRLGGLIQSSAFVAGGRRRS